MSENKKISFGFSKLAKKSNVLAKPEKSVELISCLEGSEIKLVNPVDVEEKKPLVIELRGNPNDIVGRIERESRKNKVKTEQIEEDTRPDSELTIEELAARQLLKEAKNRLAQEKDTTKVHSLPLAEEKIGASDAVEPSIDDYENVPISDYGLAMLRGMGWKEGMSIGKNQSKFVKPPELELRPKGLGLGAQRIVDVKPKDVMDKHGKELILAKGTFGKIIAGPHKGKYCEIQGLDEESGRVNVALNKNNESLTLNQLFVTPVTRDEYNLGSKIINNAKYEQFKNQQLNVKNEEEDVQITKYESRNSSNRSRKKEKRYSSEDEEENYSRKKSKNSQRRGSSSDSESYKRDKERKHKHKKHKKSKHKSESKHRH